MLTKEQLKERKTFLGGSDVAAVLGLNPYKTPFDVWKDKVSDEIIEIPQNDAMHWGNVLEDVIAQEYVRRTGRRVVRENRARRSREHPFIGGNIDRTILADDKARVDNPIKLTTGVLEAKTVSGFVYEEWENKIPLPYFCQVMNYLYVTDREWASVAVLAGGRSFYIIDILRDDDFLKTQNKELIRFWNEHVLAMVPPPMDQSDYEKILPQFGSVIEANSEIVGHCTDSRQIRDKIEQLKAEQEKHDNTIKTFIGESEALVGAGQLLATWKSQQGRVQVDYEQFEKDHPDLYKKYVSKGDPTRKFLLKFHESREIE